MDCYRCQPRVRPSSSAVSAPEAGGGPVAAVQSSPVPRAATLDVAATPDSTPETLDPDEMTGEQVDAVIEIMEQQFPGPLGFTEPRLFTPPLRELTPETSLGFAFIYFCHFVLRESLLPWQKWLAIHALELAPGYVTSTPGWRFRFKFVLVLVARQNGKSDFSRRLKLFRMYAMKAKLVIGTAQDLDVARSMLAKTNEMVDDCEVLAQQKISYITANGKEKLSLTGNREYVLKASNKKAGRGPTADHVDLDELREHHDWGAWGALSKTIRAVRNGQLWGFSNAGDDQSKVLNKLQRNATARITGKLVVDEDQTVPEGAVVAEDATQTFMAEWSARPGCELTDVDEIRQANPGLGYLFGIDSIWADLENDPAEVFRTEVLCQRVDQLDGAINLESWKDCKDEGGSLAEHRDNLVLAVEVAPDSAHVSAIITARLPGDRYRVEAAGAWDRIEAALPALRDIKARINPRRAVWFPAGPSAAIGADLRNMFDADDIYEITGAEVAETCMSFAALVDRRAVLHPNDPLLNAQVAGAGKWKTGDTWRFARSGAAHVDAVYAMAGAVQAVRTMPEEEVPVEPMVLAAW